MGYKIMNKLSRTILLGFTGLAAALMLISCKEKKNDNIKEELNNCSIEHEEEFGGIYIHEQIDAFNKLGFKYGDSVKIEFSNGKTLEDIPYYNGYYTKNGEILLVAYPGYPYIKVCINNGDDLWDQIDLHKELLQNELTNSLWTNLSLTDDVTCTVKLNEKGKYTEIQEARDIHYSDDVNDYPQAGDNYVFANFRCLSGGDLVQGRIFRSASPCDNQHNRAIYANNLMEQNGVNYIIDLADDDTKINRYISDPLFQSSRFKTLYEEGNVLPLALNMNFESDYFKEKVVVAMKAIATHEGPYLIHCTEGKDRTGFMCILLEMLGAATYTEIVDDYMTTYLNYYSFNGQFDQIKFDTIVNNVLNPMIASILNNPNSSIEGADYNYYAKKYLSDNGMTDAEITALLNNIRR